MAAALFIAFLVLQRLGELVLARRNTRRLLARGAVEHGAAHYPLIVALHAAWLASIRWFLASIRFCSWAGRITSESVSNWSTISSRLPNFISIAGIVDAVWGCRWSTRTA